MSEHDNTPLTGAVALWTKGFTVSRESPEFQLVIPNSPRELDGLERNLVEDASWAEVLPGLYRLTDRDLSNERCLMISEDHCAVVVAGLMLDKYSRAVVSVCSVHTAIDWTGQDIADTVSRAHGLAVRLLEAYTSQLMDKRSSTIERKLRKGDFLPDRTFDLTDESPVSIAEWERELDAVRAVRGVAGLATPRLLGLGANVVIGTQHEAEVVRAKGGQIDGYIDPRTSRVVALSEVIAPWSRTTPTGELRPVVDSSQSTAKVGQERKRSHHEASERQLERTIADAQRASHEAIDAWFRLIGSFFRRP